MWTTAPIGSIFFTLAALAPKSIAPYIALATWPQLIAALTAPICFAKNVINIVQLWKASKILVGVDLAERRQKQLEVNMKEE